MGFSASAFLVAAARSWWPAGAFLVAATRSFVHVVGAEGETVGKTNARPTRRRICFRRVPYTPKS